MPKMDWGFDLTTFSSVADFKKVLKENNLKFRKETIDTGTDYERTHFIWFNDQVEMTTANNPITGEYTRPKAREKEKGYASYIGITGEKEAVIKLVRSIKKNASDIKDESPRTREFI